MPTSARLTPLSLAPLALALTLAACSREPAQAAPAGRGATGAAVPPDGAPPAGVAVTGRFRRRDLIESSGAAASGTQPGVLFTINDSGNDALLYATDSTGADRGAWRVTGAKNRDWEAIAVGPCGDAAAGTGADRRCVYIGDTGDNDAVYRTRSIYRVPEPAVTAAGRTGETARAERLEYAYADGPRDVEAMTVAPDGAVALYTKRPHRGADGRLRPSLVYVLPAAAWRDPSAAVAALVDSLPAIVPGAGPGASLVTDAALSPDGRRVVVRSYTTLYVYESDPASGRPAAGARPALCDVSPLGEDLGEGVTWIGPDRLLLTSEGRGAPLHALTCPAPAR